MKSLHSYNPDSRTQQAIRLVEAGDSQTNAARKVGVNRVTLSKAWKKHIAKSVLVRCPCCDERVYKLAVPDAIAEQVWDWRRKMSDT